MGMLLTRKIIEKSSEKALHQLGESRNPAEYTPCEEFFTLLVQSHETEWRDELDEYNYPERAHTLTPIEIAARDLLKAILKVK